METKEVDTGMKITTIGLDLAKSVFHVVCFDEKHDDAYCGRYLGGGN